MDYNDGVDAVEVMAARIPDVLYAGILSVLDKHIGRDNAIGRPELIKELKSSGLEFEDRIVRLAINVLRKRGHLICSTGGRSGGYFVPENFQELETYIKRELRSRAVDLLTQESAMLTAARRRWCEVQLTLWGN